MTRSRERPAPGAGTRFVGVLGSPVRHSWSPAMMNAAFEHLGLDWRYGAFEVPPTRFAAALEGLRALGFVGANITVPHKEAAALACDELGREAELAGAVNTVVMQAGTIIGHNTDAAGFVAAAREALAFDPAGADVVILGAGGSARAVVVGLALAGAASLTVINRTAARAEAMCHALGEAFPAAKLQAAAWEPAPLEAAVARASLLVDCTVVGLEPETAPPCAIPVDTLQASAAVATLVYHREPELLARARARGLRTMDGHLMLLHQAAAALPLWTNTEAPLEVMRAALDRVR